MMDLSAFHERLAQPDARGYALDEDQREAVDHGQGPLWLIAGPGSGKSEALVTRTLKLLAVDGVDPRSILLTTFTNKAGRNLEDRLAAYFACLQDADPVLGKVDLADVRVGTVHSVCNDILQEYRYSGYRNVRLLDDVEQHLFAYRYASIANYDNLEFWAQFEHAVPAWRAGGGYSPSKWRRVKAAVVLFNRMVEDLVDSSAMASADNNWAKLAEFYRQYVEALSQRYRSDFAHLQTRFLEFLVSPSGAPFLDGDESRPPLLHVLVDEYQDTNPIQERIYLALANRTPNNITVVGDDDQALYRFRGGTVDCMVNFDKACVSEFDLQPKKVQLETNYRSHPKIVDFFNDYITSFPEMAEEGVRAPGKEDMKPGSSIGGSYPAVSWLATMRPRDLPNTVASLVKDYLLEDGTISDLSQCVLLLRSTKDSPRNAGPYIDAFERQGIPIYNPRSKTFMESEEVQCLLAALVRIIDKDRSYTALWDQDVRQSVQDTEDALSAVLSDTEIRTDELRNYLDRSQANILTLCADNPGGFLNVTLLEILYRILSREPFRTWRQDPVRNLRLSKVTRLFESYHSLNLDVLRADSTGEDLDQRFRGRFYNMFVGYLLDAGISDDEDEDVVVPTGYLPMMTIHQAKGLEFPFVFVAQLGQAGWLGSAQILERELAPFRDDPYPRGARDANRLVREDDIRLLYVAYSRAQYALVLVGTPTHIMSNVAAPNGDHESFRRNTPVIP